MSFWTEKHRQIKQKDRFFVSISTHLITTVKSVTKPSIEFDVKSYKMINHEFKYPGTAKWSDVTIKFADLGGGGFEDDYNMANLLVQMINNTGYATPYNHFGEVIGREGDQKTTHNIGHQGTKRELTTGEKSSNIANSFGPGLVGAGGETGQQTSNGEKAGGDFTAASPLTQNVSIWQVNPDGIVVECWSLVNPIVKSVNFGDLSYDSSEGVEYELVVAYDWAVHRSNENGKKFALNGGTIAAKFKSGNNTSNTDFSKTNQGNTE